MKSNISLIIWVVLGLALLVAGATYIIYPVLNQPYMAPGADTGSHVYIAKYIAEYFRAHHATPHILPYWYSNWEVLKNSPRVLPILMAALYWFINEPVKLSQYTQLIIFNLGALAMFLTLLRRFHPVNALLGAIIYGLGPTLLLDLSIIGGSPPRVLAAILIPPAFLFFDEMLEKKNRRVNLPLLVLVLAVSFLSHPLVGLLVMLMLGVYGFFRAVLDRHVTGAGLVWGLLAFISTVALCATWFIPFFLEKTGWTQLPETSKIAGSSLDWMYLKERFGFVLPLLLPLFLFLKRPKKPSDIALFLTGIFAFLFSFGDKFFVYPLFSFLSIYPFAGSFFVAFALAYLIAASFDFKAVKWWGKILAVLLCAGTLVYQSYWGNKLVGDMARFKGYFYRMPQTIATMEKVKEMYQGGRLMVMRYPFPDNIIWWAPMYEIPMVEGWYYSTTPQGKQIAWLYDAVHYGYPEYAVRRLKQLNVRIFLANSYFDSGAAKDKFATFLEGIKQDGFEQTGGTFQADKNEIFYRFFVNNQESSYLQPLKEKILVIGKDASIANSIIPGAIQGGSIYIDDYDQNILRYFPAVVLNGFGYRDKEKAETIIKEYLRQGGRVVADLNRMETSRLVDEPSFLGVSGSRQIATGPIKISSAPAGYSLPSAMPLPEELNLDAATLDTEAERFAVKEWRYIEYTNLDKQLVWREDEKDGLSALIGYKEVEGQKVWFMGPSFFYYAYLTHDEKWLDLLYRTIGSSPYDPSQPASAPTPPPAEIKVLSDNSESKSFTYDSQANFPLLVSYTYSPHWRAYLDGKEIKIYNFESLMTLDLPDGAHKVEMRYGDTAARRAGTATSWFVLSAVLSALGYGIIIYRKERAR